MKRLLILYVLACLLAGCTDEEREDVLSSSVIVLGGQIRSLGRAAQDITRFEEGDRISFFSKGGIEADNILLTYINKEWEHGGDLTWNASGEEAVLAAYYPCFALEDWNFYDGDGFLKDLVCARKEVAYGLPVELEFKHLFSKLVFEADETVNGKIQSITFTPSVQVKAIEPYTGTIALTGNAASSFQIAHRSDRIYSFLVPSVPDVTVDIDITTPQGVLSLEATTPQTYESGHEYTYHLIAKEEEVGIYTAEDFIAFSHLINQMEYEGRTLEEFGKNVDGVMTYYLRSDIRFTEEESKRVQPIGFKKYASGDRDDYAFTACFDGLGHTLFDLQIITAENASFQGLFGYIEKEGVVKNLVLENCSHVNTFPNAQQHIGLLAGLNNGTIIGCHVKSCVVADEKFSYAAGLVSNNSGVILNSSVDNIQFKGSELRIGGFCYENGGVILNSYVTRCQCSEVDKAGGLCYNLGVSSILANCYVTFLDYPTDEFGPILYNVNGRVSIGICYYSGNITLYPVYDGYKNVLNKDDIHTFDNNYITTNNGKHLLDALNGWIDENQAIYPDYPLLHWQKGDGNVPFIHQSLP